MCFGMVTTLACLVINRETAGQGVTTLRGGTLCAQPPRRKVCPPWWALCAAMACLSNHAPHEQQLASPPLPLALLVEALMAAVLEQPTPSSATLWLLVYLFAVCAVFTLPHKNLRRAINKEEKIGSLRDNQDSSSSLLNVQSKSHWRLFLCPPARSAADPHN